MGLWKTIKPKNKTHVYYQVGGFKNEKIYILK